MAVDYPPAPWHLTGEMFGLWTKIPAKHVPADFRPERIRTTQRDGSVLVAAYVIDYRDPGMLAYRELVVSAILPKMTYPSQASIRRIWVDSPESLAGGRELWDIPKRLAKFDVEYGVSCRGTVFADGAELASYRFVPRLTLPGQLPFHLVTVQESLGEDDIRIRRTRSLFRARLQIGKGELEVPEDSELAFLRHGIPKMHVGLRSFRATFGQKTRLGVK
jgi:acetoacetate decarboxylase